jgi:hypothetical protein
MYDSVTKRRRDGSKITYSAGCVFVVDNEQAAEWMEGSPPVAWPDGEERPKSWPLPPDPGELPDDDVGETVYFESLLGDDRLIGD